MSVHRYAPRGTCIEVLNSREPELLFGGPAGTGKSRACLEKMHLLMMLNPGARGLMVRKTLTSLTSTGLVTFREHVAKEHIESGEVRWYGGSPQEAACYKYKNGSTLVVGGMDKAMKIMSSEYDVVYVQEATELTEDDWEKITTRLRNGKISFQQLLADCNPDVPTHWLKRRCDEGLTKYVPSRHEDNPTLFDADGNKTARGVAFMGNLDRLTGVRYQRLRLGNWVAAEGLVYENYDQALHLRRPMAQPPKGWPVYLSIDFGFTNPFVCQFWTLDPDGRLILYREIYKTRTLVEDHAAAIKEELKRQRNPTVTQVICDHDAEDRATLTRHLGMATVAAKKTVSDGLQAVSARLSAAGDGKPRLLLARDALVDRDALLVDDAKPTCTAQEIVGYVWDIKEGKVPKEVPVKENDHGMDAMRYMVAHLDLKGRTQFRSFTL